MSRSSEPNLFEQLTSLFRREQRNILRRELHNENKVHLYRLGDYWVAFEKSAYLLEQISLTDADPTVIYMQEHPFPMLMTTINNHRANGLCRHRISGSRQPNYLQIHSGKIDTALYNEWYRTNTID